MIETEVIEGDVSESIIGVSDSYDVTVIGAPTKNPLVRFVFGSKADEIEEKSEDSVVMCKSGEGSLGG
ncbi:MAG: universal stress protein [Halobacteria archaeon]|nr:universal stress protein [Halobacteria archaeon]